VKTTLRSSTTLICILATVATISIGFVVYALAVEPHRITVETCEVEVSGLHSVFDGLRIIQLTDFHSTSLGPLERAAFRAAQSLRPDLLAFTGDLCESPAVARELAHEMVDLQPAFGCFLIMGNAEYDGDAEAIVQAVSSAGMIVLRNDVRQITKGRGKLWVIGVDDPSTGRSFLEGALLKLRGDQSTPRLLLAHFPTVFTQAVHWGIDVVLAGHTHGGQIVLPGLGDQMSYGSEELNKFRRGDFREGTTWMHVSRGLGTSKIPLRIGSPPEVTLIVLRAAGPPVARPLPQPP
jgi:predicted MPP superfamily phosphohydrolase